MQIMQKNIIKKYKGKDILITGGTGFIGLNLVKTLKEAGAHLTVTFLRKNKLNSKEKEILIGVTKKAMDIRNRRVIEKLVRGKDYIFHLAGQSGAVASMKDPVLDMEVNCIGSLNLLEACRLLNPGAAVLSLGSRLEFGRPQYLPVDEKHPLVPTSIHGVNKITIEKYFILYHRIYNLKTIYLRVTNPYGSYQRKESKNFGIINFFIQKLLRDETVEIFGGGKQLRDYIYVGDLVEAMLRAFLIPEAYGEAFNIGSGQGISLLDMVKSIIRIANCGSFKKIPWPSEFKEVETGDFIADISKARKILGWQPGVNIEEGLKKTIAGYL